MSGPQIAYAVALAALFVWRGPSFTAWVLLGNMGAALVGCYAMDLGLIGRTDTTLAMMLIDFVSASLLLTQSGLPRVIAAGYAVTIPLYALNVVFGVSEGTTFALVIGLGFVQLVVAGIGSDSDDRGNHSRNADMEISLSAPGRNSGMVSGGFAQVAGLLSQDHRGLN